MNEYDDSIWFKSKYFTNNTFIDLENGNFYNES